MLKYNFNKQYETCLKILPKGPQIEPKQEKKAELWMTTYAENSLNYTFHDGLCRRT